MARRNAAVRRAQTSDDAPDAKDQQQDAAQQGRQGTAAAGRRAGARAGRQRQRGQVVPADSSEQQAQFVDPVESMSWHSYYARQYGGVTLGALACCNSLAFYDQQDPHKVWKMMSWLLLALLALAIHEMRPFRRMNYGDKAREQGLGMRQLLGF